MFWSRWTRGARAPVEAGRALYAQAAAQARQPEFYAALRAPDTANGRFELYSLHIILLLHRLKDRGEEAAEASQALFDTYISALDAALREQGVGDLSMSKSMRRLGEAFYGRVRSYDAALAAPAELEALIARTIYGGDAAPAPLLADYVRRCVEGLAEQPDATILRGTVAWPAVRA
jgi:cytochrome b pre-mRNA-processing protein 3